MKIKEKKCGNCKKMLPISQYKLSKKSKDGFQSKCLECRKKSAQYYQINKDHICANQMKLRKQYKKKNEILSDENLSSLSKICIICEKELHGSLFYKDPSRNDGLSNRCKTCDLEQTNEWADKNRDKSNTIKRNWEKNNPVKANASSRNWAKNNPVKVKTIKLRYQNKRRQDPVERIMDSFKMSLKQCLFSKTEKPSKSFVFEVCKYDIDTLKKHLETHFDDKMNWDNYGEYWHIDHRWPIKHFKFKSQNDVEFKLCWSLENLQPLSKTLNNKKRARIIYKYVKDLTFFADLIKRSKDILEYDL